MQPTAAAVTSAVSDEAAKTLDHSLRKIKHCVDQLTGEQVWWRPRESMNSIGNLILHLTGNVRQWILSGVGGEEDVRHRPSEFSARGLVPNTVLLAELEAVVSKAMDVLRQTGSNNMMAERRIQGFATTGWGAVFDCVPHFRGHAQEIICLTRLQLGDAYQFHWEPQTPEEGM